MRRASHALLLLLAIVAVVVTGPIVMMRASTFALDRFDRGPDATPDWWPLVSTASIPLFVAAVLFLLWDSHRIGAREEAGVLLRGLRVPPPRRRRRLPRALR